MRDPFNLFDIPTLAKVLCDIDISGEGTRRGSSSAKMKDPPITFQKRDRSGLNQI
jgi:hypothetical protein